MARRKGQDAKEFWTGHIVSTGINVHQWACAHPAGVGFIADRNRVLPCWVVPRPRPRRCSAQRVENGVQCAASDPNHCQLRRVVVATVPGPRVYFATQRRAAEIVTTLSRAKVLKQPFTARYSALVHTWYSARRRIPGDTVPGGWMPGLPGDPDPARGGFLLNHGRDFTPAGERAHCWKPTSSTRSTPRVRSPSCTVSTRILG